MAVYEFYLWLCAIVGTAVALHSIFLLRGRYAMKGFVYPFLVLLCALGASYSFVELRGYPVSAYPQGKIEIVSHVISGGSITFTARHQNGDWRLYRIPDTKENHEAVEEAAKERRQGKVMEVSFGTDGNIPKMKLVRVDQLMPK